MSKFLFIVMAIVLTACSGLATEMPTQIPTEIPTDLPTGDSGDIESARQQWEAAGISHYRFNLNMVCFCAFSENMPLVVEVQDGNVVSMEYQNGNEIDPASLEFFQRYETIDKIFSELEKAIAAEADEVTVTYDDTYGFPEQVDIDFVEEAIDDELVLTISGFEALP
jgi:hypothetical protein